MGEDPNQNKQKRTSSINASSGDGDTKWYSVRIGQSVRDKITKFIKESKTIGGYDFDQRSAYDLALRDTLTHLGKSDEKFLSLLPPNSKLNAGKKPNTF